MSSSQPTQPFRFLDLPGEIRNNVYDLLLCSWDIEVDRRYPSYQTTTLLRANKQIQNEASDYMIKRNQFIRVTCRGLDIRNLFLEDGVPVITTDSREVRQFTGYAMHMTLSVPFSLSTLPFSEFEMMILRADLPSFCKKLDIETVMADPNLQALGHSCIHAEVKLNYALSHFFTPKIQQHLLSPIATHLRGIPNLRIVGPVDAALATTVAGEVTMPRWTEPDAMIEEIGTGVDVGKRQWQQQDYYTAADSWAYALRTLERMRHSSSWLGLREAGGEAFVNKTADLYFTLNLLHAAFLQVDMANGRPNEPLVHRNGTLAMQHLHKCETARARFFKHAGATWAPSAQQSSKMRYRYARCLRLMNRSQNRVRAVTSIEEAAALAPNDLVIWSEKDAVLSWSAGIEEAQRLLEEQIAEPAAPVRNRSMWSSMWNAVTRVAAF